MVFEIYYATSNEKKVESLKNALGPQNEDDPKDMNKDIKIIQKELIIPERKIDDIKEIALDKILRAYKEFKKPVIVHDGGFYMHAWNGFPQTNINFALNTLGTKGILVLANAKQDRACEFRDCLIYYNPQEEPDIDYLIKELYSKKELLEPIDYLKCFFSVNKGKIADEPAKDNLHQEGWSPLWDIFIPGGSDKTLSELPYEERKEAREISLQEPSVAEQFVEWFCKYKKN